MDDGAGKYWNGAPLETDPWATRGHVGHRWKLLWELLLLDALASPGLMTVVRWTLVYPVHVSSAGLGSHVIDFSIQAAGVTNFTYVQYRNT